jgi:hypothetical protein
MDIEELSRKIVEGLDSLRNRTNFCERKYRSPKMGILF